MSDKYDPPSVSEPTLWVRLWTDTEAVDMAVHELTDVGECVMEIGMEFAIRFLENQGYEHDDSNHDLFSMCATAFELAFHLARKGQHDELVASRIMEAVMTLEDAATKYDRNRMIETIKAGYEFGVAMLDKTPDEIWAAWQADPRSFGTKNTD